MCAPKQFREDRQNVLIETIRSIQFGALIVVGEAGLEIAHLPMTVRETTDSVILESHVAIGNSFWHAIGGGTEALLIFQGPHSYVHPGWLETKRSTGKAVPTWNYIVVHARGYLSVERDPEWLRAHVTELTATNEADRSDPWAVSDAPGAYVDAMLGAIVGLRLRVDTFDGIWKLIQHHPMANRLGTIAGLHAEQSTYANAIASIMADRDLL